MDDVKTALHEMIVLPVQRPDLYTGLRSPGKGILLFGPPGTGKTMAAKAVASSSNATFFSISASTLGSKYHGESEKLMKALFYVARKRQPSFIFIDEIDSMLGSRGEGEHEASRRLKTEFLVQFDGAAGSKDDAVYVVGATNRPQDLDDAVRRRLNKRIYVPLPDATGRLTLLEKLTISGSKDVKWELSRQDLKSMAAKIEFYSGADIHALCREAALMPLRELGTRIAQVDARSVRAVSRADLDVARATVKPSASRAQLLELENWDREFGSTRRPPPGSSGPGDSNNNGGAVGAKRAGTRPRNSGTNQESRQKDVGNNEWPFGGLSKGLSTWRSGRG
jgi:spastin